MRSILNRNRGSRCGGRTIAEPSGIALASTPPRPPEDPIAPRIVSPESTWPRDRIANPAGPQSSPI